MRSKGSITVIIFITCISCIIVLAETSATDVIVNEKPTCTEEMKDKINEKTPREKSLELQKLQAQNTSALMIKNFMNEYVNWDEFLYDLPVMVTELGKLMLFSNKRDFSLVKEGISYNFIERPESFRATLVQLAHTEWTTLHAAHQNMDTIRLNSLSVPGVFKIIFKTIGREKTAANENLLFSQLDRISKFAEQNRDVCQDSISKINHTISLINEIQMATISAQSEQKDQLNMLKKEKVEFEAKMKNAAKMLESIDDTLQSQLETVKNLEKKYGEAQTNADVNILELFAGAAVDVLKFIPVLASAVLVPDSPIETPETVLPEPTTESGNITESDQIVEMNEVADIAEQMEEVMGNELDDHASHIIDKSLAKLSTIRDKSISSELQQHVKEVRSSHHSASGMNSLKRKKMKGKFKKVGGGLKGQSLSLLLKNTETNGQSINFNRRLDDFMDQSKSTYGQIMSTRLKQLKHATKRMLNANQQYEDLFNKKLGIMERNTEYISRLESIDFTEIDFESILKTMREGIVVLGSHIEHWKRLYSFFSIIDSLTRVATERTKLFVDGTLMGIRDGALMNGYTNDDIYMDILYEHCFLTFDIAKALNEMASTYMRVSNAHVFPHLNSITKLLALDDPKEINDAFKKLASNALISTKEFTDDLKQDYIKQQNRMRRHVGKISCYMEAIKSDEDVMNAVNENNLDIDIPDFEF